MWNNHVTRVIILQSFKKGTLWKFWFDPRFSRNSKFKWTLKWLPFDRGYFKIYFYKSESILIISYHMYFGTRVRHFILGHVRIIMHICSCSKMFCNSVLLIDNPSKRGDVETAARSSVSPSSQVKMKLKLVVSR